MDTLQAVIPPFQQVGVGEYQTFFIDASTKLPYGLGRVPNMGVGGSGTDGLPLRLITSPTNLTFASVYGSLHGGAGVDSNGSVWVTGDNNQGQYGNGTTTPSSTASLISTDSAGAPFKGIVQMASYYSMASSVGWFAIKGDGSLWVWGQAINGLSGNGTSSAANVLRPTAVTMPGARKVVQITAGYSALALCSDGTVWQWGWGTLTPTQVAVPVAAVQIAGGTNFNYAVAANGDLYGWGNYGSYLAIPQSVTSGSGNAIPKPVLCAGAMKAFGGPVQKIYVSTVASYAILTNGTLWAWGDASQGIGIGQSLDMGATKPPYAWDGLPGDLLIQTPVRISNYSDWTAVYTSPNYTYYAYAQRSNGQLYSWGRNKGGVLGNGIQGPANGDISSSYPNSWDVATCTPVNPLQLKAIVFSPSPYCVLNPGTSPCNEWLIPAHTSPVADAGAAQTLPLSATSGMLTGAASKDPNTGGVIMAYSWKQLSGPSAAVFSLASEVSPVVSSLVPGVYIFQLTVTNQYFSASSATVQVTVTKQVGPPPTKTIVSVLVSYSDGSTTLVT